jgi:cellulose synthase (UDP-forming)
MRVDRPLPLHLDVPADARPAESRHVFTWWDYPIFIALSVLGVWAIAVLGAYWFGSSDWRAAPVPFVLVSLLLVVSIAIQQLRWWSLPLMRRPYPVPPPSGFRVAVATTFVPAAEPLAMLERTVAGLVAMDYPHDTWVLDEGNDEHVRALCLRLGARHFSRKALPEYQTSSGTYAARTKHGNYNAWLHHVGYGRYDLLAAFDPDHVPERHYLTRTLGYFADPRIGYVQAPQAYYNQRASFIAQGGAEETYAYYSSTQMANDALGYPVVTGCHTVHRLAALERVGDFAAHDADDLLITLRYRATGWRGLYVPEILARGLTPVDWAGYLTQQRRWARSVLDVKFRHYPRLAAGLPLGARVLGSLQGVYYVRAVGTALGLIALVLWLAGGNPPRASWDQGWHVLPLSVTVLLADLYRQRFYLGGRHERGLHWRAAVLEFAKWPYILLALAETARGYCGPYVLTRKLGTSGRPWLLILTHGLVSLAVTTAWLLGWLLGQRGLSLVHAVGALVALGSVAVIASTWMAFPPPYDPDLATRPDTGAPLP